MGEGSDFGFGISDCGRLLRGCAHSLLFLSFPRRRESIACFFFWIPAPRFRQDRPLREDESRFFLTFSDSPHSLDGFRGGFGGFRARSRLWAVQSRDVILGLGIRALRVHSLVGPDLGLWRVVERASSLLRLRYWGVPPLIPSF